MGIKNRIIGILLGIMIAIALFILADLYLTHYKFDKDIIECNKNFENRTDVTITKADGERYSLEVETPDAEFKIDCYPDDGYNIWQELLPIKKTCSCALDLGGGGPVINEKSYYR